MAVDVITESSPAAVPTDAQEYAEWRLTGRTPAPKAPAAKQPKAEASATSKESSAAADDAAENGAPASEAGDKQEHKRSNAESRLNELLADLKKAGLSPAQLKTYKRELAKAEPPKETPEKTEKPAGSKMPSKPKAADFKTYEEYEEARDQYYEAVAEHKAQKRIEEYKQELAQDKVKSELTGKLKAARERYGEAADETIGATANAVFEDKTIPAAVKAIIDDSAVMVDLLYAIGSKADERDELLELARTNPGAAIRKVVLIERLVTEELAGKNEASGAAERGEDGKFVSKEKAPATKKVSEAPPPPKEAGGRAAAPADEVEAAAKANDFATFRSAANRRDLAHRKGL